jgi:hypothetical protein
MQGYSRTIPEFVARSKKLNSGDKLFYGLLSALCSKYGYCWATNSYLSECSGISSRQLQRYLLKLQKLGFAFIEIEYKNTRKIWTVETYSMKDKLIETFGEEKINQTFDRYDINVGGVRHIGHTPAIYKEYDTRVDKKKEDRALPSTSSPPPFSSIKKTKQSEAKQSTAKVLSTEEIKDLENKMGKESVDKYTKNALAHLKKCPKSAYHKMSLFEIISKFHKIDQEEKSKASEEKIKAGKELVSEVIKLNPHVRGHIIKNTKDVDVGKPEGMYCNCFSYDDPKLRSAIVTFLLRLGKPYKMPK